MIKKEKDITYVREGKSWLQTYDTLCLEKCNKRYEFIPYGYFPAEITLTSSYKSPKHLTFYTAHMVDEFYENFISVDKAFLKYRVRTLDGAEWRTEEMKYIKNFTMKNILKEVENEAQIIWQIDFDYE